jgi:hypothetical protein
MLSKEMWSPKADWAPWPDARGTVAFQSAAPPASVGYVDLTSFEAALHAPEDKTALRAALGTVAPTRWIVWQTYEIALEHFAPLRPNPDFLDPQPVEVKSFDGAYHLFVSWLMSDREIEVLAAPALAAVIVPEKTPVEGLDTDEPAVVPPPPPPVSEVRAAASEIREISGLGAEKLGALFPVERESYQRWISGVTEPSAGNLERLYALRHFLRALADRVDNAKHWLLSPLPGSPDGRTAYDTIKAGNLTRLWDAIALLPSRTSSEPILDSDGNYAVRRETSMRAFERPLPEEELDDYSEWFDEE